MSYETKSYKSAAKQLNDQTYTDYYYNLMLLARSVFKWSNLPNGIDEKWIERFLYYDGACIFFKNKETGFMVARAARNGINEYDEPTELTPIFTNSCLKDIQPLKNNKECILIRNNDLGLPTDPAIRLFALRLTDLQRTIDVNVKAQKTPVLIKSSSKQKLSLKQTFVQWEGNEPVIHGDKDMDTTGIEALRIDAPVVFDKLQHQKSMVWNEAMTRLGINNANMDKRERLVANEVQANNEQIELSAAVMLKSRQLACERINQLFGTNIKVDLRNPVELKNESVEGIENE